MPCYTRTSSRVSIVVREAESIREQPVMSFVQPCVREAAGDNPTSDSLIDAELYLREAGATPTVKQTEKTLQFCGWSRSEAKHDASRLWRAKESQHV